MRLYTFFLSLIFFSVLFFTPDFTLAANQGSIELDPAYTEGILDRPEKEETITLTFKNNSKASVNMEIFPIDFKQQNEKGGISFIGKEAGSYSYSLSSFLTFESNHLDIDPGKKAELNVTIKNRLDLSPGGHYAAVVGRIVNESNDKNVVFPAISSLIFMRKVGGERFNLSIKDVGWPRNLLVFNYPTSFEITFQNEGNTHLIPYGRGEIKDMFGRVLFKGIVNTSSAIVMPETRRIVPIQFKPISSTLPVSFNRLSIKGNDSIKKTTFIYEESFIYFSPTLLILPFILLVLWFLRKRRRA